jgi:rfaE bifunctional protein kinase chain/domain
MNRNKNLIEQFKKLNLAVLGDLMLDKYIYGSVERISPEAPIPIVLVKEEKYVLGGAANVAANITSLGARAHLFGVVGKDEAQMLFLKNCELSHIDASGVFSDKARPTIQKIRVIGQHQQLLRIDYEKETYLEKNNNDFFIGKLQSLSQLDAIILSDYAKGAINEDLAEKVKEIARIKKIPLIVDPKPKHKLFYKNVSLITPNLKEAQELSGIHVDSLASLERCGACLNDFFNCDIIITTGEKGMSIFPLRGTMHHIPTQATEVYDVSGAGDTVAATLTLALASGADLRDAAELANIAAGIKVKKLGTATVSWKELLLTSA